MKKILISLVTLFSVATFTHSASASEVTDEMRDVLAESDIETPVSNLSDTEVLDKMAELYATATPPVPSDCQGSQVFWAIDVDGNGRIEWISGDPRGYCGDSLNVLVPKSECEAQAASGFQCLSVKFGSGSLHWNVNVDY